MAFARVVEFDGVSSGRVAEMKREIEGGAPPEGMPATEILVLHDPDAERSVAIVFFETEDDYARRRDPERHARGGHTRPAEVRDEVRRRGPHGRLALPGRAWRSPGTASTPQRGRATGSPARSTSTRSRRRRRLAPEREQRPLHAGARTAWHTHPNGQTIWVTEGVGLCQRRGGPVEVIRPGDRVFFEPGEEHWHGAAPDPLHDAHRDARGRRRGQHRDLGRPRHRRGVRSRTRYRQLRPVVSGCEAPGMTPLCACRSSP